MNYINTFFAEKDIDPEETFEFDSVNGFNIMPYGVVIEAIKTTSGEERAKIQRTLWQIDFHNGDVKHFLRHLGQGLAANNSHL